MAQLPIDYGAAANNGLGTNWRTAWQRTQDNFTDLYSTQSRTINAGDVRFASQPTTEAKIQAAINQAVIELAARVYVPAFMLPYDATLVNFEPTVQMVAEGLNQGVWNVDAYGASDDGLIDATPAFVAALQGINGTFGVEQGGCVEFSSGTYLLSSNPFLQVTSLTPCRIVGAGMQVTVLKKGFNGSWFTYGVNFGNYIRWENITFDGQHDAGRTGAGFVYSGNAVSAGNDYHSYFRCRFLAIESHFLIGSNAAAALSILDCEGYPSAAQQGVGTYSFLASSADDTFGNARHRRISHSLFPLGIINIDGMQDVYMSAVGVTRFETSATSSEYYVSACLLGNSVASEPLSGQGAVVGCRFAGDVVLDSSFTGAFVGNFQTAGTFTDNTVAGAATIVHHPLGAGYHHVGQKHTIPVYSSTATTIATSRTANFGDQDWTIGVGNAPVIFFNNNLAANRTITLPTTNYRNGDRYRFVRKGLGAFTMDIGPGLKTIPSATAAFVDVEFTGSAWVLTGYGTL